MRIAVSSYQLDEAKNFGFKLFTLENMKFK